MPRIDRLTIALSAVLVLASPWPMLGQAPPILPSTKVILAGPASLYPTIALRDAGTDSNVYQDSVAPREDVTYKVTPRLYAVVPIGGSRFTGTGTGDFVFYRTYTDQQSVNAAFDGRYEVVDARLRPFAAASFSSYRERKGLEVDARARQSVRAMTFGADVALSPITSLTGWVRREDVTWDRSARYDGVVLAEQLDSTADLLAAGARFHFTPFTTLVAVAEIQRDRFEDAPIRNADSLRLAPALEFNNGGAITGQVRAGYRAFRPLDSSIEGYSGFTASAGISYALLEWTRIYVEGGHDVKYSYDPLQPFYLESGTRIRAIQRVVGPFEVVGVAERWRLRNQRIGGTAFDGRQEDTTTIGGGVGVRLGNQMELTMTIDRTERTSSEAGRGYDRHRVLASISYGL